MNDEKLSLWVRVILAIITVFLRNKGQQELIRGLLDRHDDRGLK